MLDQLIPAFVTLFVIIDPIGLVPIFLALTTDADSAHRRRMARLGCVIAFGILALFALTGQQLLALLGISLPAFRIAGGLLLFLIALEMVFEKRTQRREERAGETQAEQLVAPRNEDIAAFPLAIPFIAGPGAIASIMLLMGSHGGEPWLQFGVLLAAAAVIVITWALFLLADRVAHVLPRTLTLVITRLLGILLAALSVQFVVDGIVALTPP